MNGKTLLPAIAAVTLALLCVLTYRELQDERSKSAELWARIMAREAVTIPQSARDRMSGGATPGTTDPTAMASAPMAVAGLEPQSTGWPEHRVELERRRRLMNDPDYRAARLALHLESLQRQNPDLMSELGLTTDQKDSLFDMLSKQLFAEGVFILEQNLQNDGAEMTPQRIREFEQVHLARRQEDEAARKVLLGEGLYGKWGEYTKSADARAQVRDLRGRLAEGTSPLQDTQFNRLVSLLADEDRRLLDEQRVLQESLLGSDKPTHAELLEYESRQLTVLEESQKRAREAVNAYLDAEQQKRFGEIQQSKLERERNQSRVRRAAYRFESGEAARVHQ